MNAGAEGRWWQPFSRCEDIDVIHVDLHPGHVPESDAAAWLDQAETARARRFRVARARRRYVYSRAALRANLCRRLDCRNERLSFGYLEHGKPFAVIDGTTAPGSFNLSHSGEHGLIAFAPARRLGIDLEMRNTRTDVEAVGGAVFGRNEQAALRAAQGGDRARLFFRVWTMKEALIKALGTGFSLNPATFEIPMTVLAGERSGAFRFPGRPDTEWRLADLGEARFAAAIAWEP